MCVLTCVGNLQRLTLNLCASMARDVVKVLQPAAPRLQVFVLDNLRDVDDWAPTEDLQAETLPAIDLPELMELHLPSSAKVIANLGSLKR